MSKQPVNAADYRILVNYGPDEMMGYRVLPDGRIEIMNVFCGEVKTIAAHMGDMRKVLEDLRRGGAA